MSLKGKVGVVTSSTSGIGLGIARAFAGAGADIFINGFGERDVIEGIRRKVADEYKVRVAYSGADMSKAPEIAAMIAQATKELGGVDILVNNAGIQYTAPVRDFPAEQWEAIIAINLFAAFYPTQAALPYMLERNWSRVRRRARRALCSQDRSVISARTLPTEQQPGTAMPVITGMSFSRRHLPCSGCALVRASCTRPLPIRRIEGRGSSGFVVAAVSELEPLDGRAGLGTRRLLTYASRSRSFLLAWT